MEFIYAAVDEKGYFTGLIGGQAEINKENYIRVPVFDSLLYIGKKYVNGEWVNVENGPEFVDTLKEINDLKKDNEDIRASNEQFNEDLGNLLLQSAQDTATIAELTETVGGLLFEVAALKGGAA